MRGTNTIIILIGIVVAIITIIIGLVWFGCGGMGRAFRARRLGSLRGAPTPAWVPLRHLEGVHGLGALPHMAIRRVFWGHRSERLRLPSSPYASVSPQGDARLPAHRP